MDIEDSRRGGAEKASGSGAAKGAGSKGSFFILIEQKAVELRFEVGASGLGPIDFEAEGTSSEEFLKGLVALVVDETEQGNLISASKVAGILADYYARDVLVLDAQLHQNDTLVGEMHFIDGDTWEVRRNRALDVLNECVRPSTVGHTVH